MSKILPMEKMRLMRAEEGFATPRKARVTANQFRANTACLLRARMVALLRDKGEPEGDVAIAFGLSTRQIRRIYDSTLELRERKSS